MCDPHRTREGDEKHGFPDLASIPVVTVYQWFGLKTTATVSWIVSQNQGRWFGDFDQVDGLVILTSKSPR
jgi:hypothetical protein